MARRPYALRTLELSPRIAIFEAYFGLFLATEYEHAAAKERIARALELDAHSSVVQFLAASAFCLMGDFDAVHRHVDRSLELHPESLGLRWPQTVAFLLAGRFDEAITAAERVIARTRAPIYLGVMGMVYARAGRLADARRVAQELDERQSRGEYIVPAARLSIHLGFGDGEGVRRSLAACLDGAAAPFSVVATSRSLLDNYRGHADIDPLLDRLYDGARPSK